MFVDENPDATLDEVLAHFGVLGMKWGKHRAKASGSDIRSARARLMVEQDKLHNAKRSAKKIKNPAAKAMAEARVAEQKTAFLKNPDRVTASRLTRGEKAVALLLLPGAGALAIAGSSAASRRIEFQQDKTAGRKP